MDGSFFGFSKSGLKFYHYNRVSGIPMKFIFAKNVGIQDTLFLHNARLDVLFEDGAGY